MIRYGCCGFRSARKKYFETFNTVEVQQTFYQPPKVATLQGWREEAPEGFEFTMKAWQLVTHEGSSPTYRRLKRELSDWERGEAGAFRPTAIVREGWETTRECAEALGARRILLQCPARFTPTPEHIENLRGFITSIERRDLVLLWEPRGPAWTEEIILELCTELDLVHVVDPFAAMSLTPDAPYYRLHGRTGFRYVYEDDEFSDLLSTLPEDSDSYVLFNNVRMAEDAARFGKMIRDNR